MNLQHRIELLDELGQYMLSDDDQWLQVKQRAERENSWFTWEFINLAIEGIAQNFLSKSALIHWTSSYVIPSDNPRPHTVGVVMAGNIPLVGFHDLLSVFITGNKAHVKLSSRDQILIKHLVEKLASRDPEINELISFSEMIKGCDAYIATGSNNTAGYFEYYFGKYPNIIRRNRTSVAILNGEETKEELDLLAGDVYQYFGLGCRNVTKIYVPREYDFIPLLNSFRKYNHIADNHKYKNNYDYNLAIQILNKKFYMSNESLLLVEQSSIFSPISQLNYEFYDDYNGILKDLRSREDVQCLVGKGMISFGQAQRPLLTDYADGVDTIEFLMHLPV